MFMRHYLVSFFGILINKAGHFVGIVNRSWSLNTTYSIVVQETKLESQLGNQILYLLKRNAFFLTEIIFHDKIA